MSGTDGHHPDHPLFSEAWCGTTGRRRRRGIYRHVLASAPPAAPDSTVRMAATPTSSEEGNDPAKAGRSASARPEPAIIVRPKTIDAAHGRRRQRGLGHRGPVGVRTSTMTRIHPCWPICSRTGWATVLQSLVGEQVLATMVATDEPERRRLG